MTWIDDPEFTGDHPFGPQTLPYGVIDTGDNLGDYPRGWQLSVSDDGTNWRTAATGTGTTRLRADAGFPE